MEQICELCNGWGSGPKSDTNCPVCVGSGRVNVRGRVIQQIYTFAKPFTEPDKLRRNSYYPGPLDETRVILEKYDATSEMVYAGLLYDILNRTTCTTRQISDNFGKQVFRMLDPFFLVPFMSKRGTLSYSDKGELGFRIQNCPVEAKMVEAAGFMATAKCLVNMNMNLFRMFYREKSFYLEALSGIPESLYTELLTITEKILKHT